MLHGLEHINVLGICGNSGVPISDPVKLCWNLTI